MIACIKNASIITLSHSTYILPIHYEIGALIFLRIGGEFRPTSVYPTSMSYIPPFWHYIRSQIQIYRPLAEPSRSFLPPDFQIDEAIYINNLHLFAIAERTANTLFYTVAHS